MEMSINDNAGIKRKHLDYIDELKGFAIILVVWGHCGALNYFYNSLYYIHLSVFIMVTGMMLYYSGNWKKPCSYMFKLLKSLMYPFLTFGLMSILLNVYLNTIGGTAFSIKFRIKEIFCLGYDACWYLPALFIGETVAIFVIYLSKEVLKKNYMIFISLGIIIFATSILRVFLWEYYGEYAADSFLSGKKMLLLLVSSRSLFFAVFVLIGYIIFPYLQKMTQFLKWKGAAISIVVFTVMLFVTRKAGFVDLRLVNWQHTSVYLVCSVIIGLAAIIFFMSLNRKIPFLQFIGKNSLVIMGVHLSFKKIWFADVFLRKIIPLSIVIKPTLYSIILTAFVIAISVPYIYIFKAFPFILNFNCLVDRIKGIYRNILRRGSDSK